MEPTLPTDMEGLMYTTASAQAIVMILTAEFSLLFAYVAGTHFFLHSARLPLRIYAFVGIVVIVISLWVMLWAQLEAYVIYMALWDMADQAGRSMQYDGMSLSGANAILEILIWAFHIVHLSALAGLTYLTFIFDWSQPERAK